jgi:hypothetical protein
MFHRLCLLRARGAQQETTAAAAGMAGAVEVATSWARDAERTAEEQGATATSSAEVRRENKARLGEYLAAQLQLFVEPEQSRASLSPTPSTSHTFSRPTTRRGDHSAGGGDGDDVCCVCLAALVRTREGAGHERPGFRWETQQAAAAAAAAAVIVRLPCWHRMHRDCLAPWVLQQAVLCCPVCRQQAMLPDERARTMYHVGAQRHTAMQG